MKANESKVIFFQPFDFKKGQKINITSGPRQGDWEVIGVGERKVRLKCPVTHKEFEWNLFCYLVDERTVDQWPTH